MKEILWPDLGRQNLYHLSPCGFEPAAHQDSQVPLPGAEELLLWLVCQSEKEMV